MNYALLRHPELVSGSISPHAPKLPAEEWTLKQVQGDDGSSVGKRRQPQSHGQVMPIGVITLDQIDLPLPVPALQLLLTKDRAFHIAEQLVADETVDFVAAGEALDSTVAMLPEPSDEVAGDTDIERAMRLTGKDVNAGLPLLSHRPENAASWMLKQVQHDGISENYPPLRHPELVSGSIRPSTL